MENIFLQYQKPKLEANPRVAKPIDLLVMHGLEENAIKVKIAKIGTLKTASSGTATKIRTDA